MNILTSLALKSIVFYKKYMSPYKGFSCPLRTLANEDSCSTYGYKVINRFGVITGYKLLQRRFYDCAWSAKQLEGSYLGTQMRNSMNMRTKFQRGSIDCGTPDCDSGCVPDCSGSKGKGFCSSACDTLDFCDLFGKDKKNENSSFSQKRERKNKSKYAPEKKVDLNK